MLIEFVAASYTHSSDAAPLHMEQCVQHGPFEPIMGRTGPSCLGKRKHGLRIGFSEPLEQRFQVDAEFGFPFWSSDEREVRAWLSSRERAKLRMQSEEQHKGQGKKLSTSRLCERDAAEESALRLAAEEGHAQQRCFEARNEGAASGPAQAAPDADVDEPGDASGCADDDDVVEVPAPAAATARARPDRAEEPLGWTQMSGGRWIKTNAVAPAPDPVVRAKRPRTAPPPSSPPTAPSTRTVAASHGRATMPWAVEEEDDDDDGVESEKDDDEREGEGEGEEEGEEEADKSNWACCDKCSKWRRLPAGEEYCAEALGDGRWFCHMNPDGRRNTCRKPEERFGRDEEWNGVVQDDGDEEDEELRILKQRIPDGFEQVPWQQRASPKYFMLWQGYACKGKKSWTYGEVSASIRHKRFTHDVWLKGMPPGHFRGADLSVENYAQGTWKMLKKKTMA